MLEHIWVSLAWLQATSVDVSISATPLNHLILTLAAFPCEIRSRPRVWDQTVMVAPVCPILNLRAFRVWTACNGNDFDWGSGTIVVGRGIELSPGELHSRPAHAAPTCVCPDVGSGTDLGRCVHRWSSHSRGLCPRRWQAKCSASSVGRSSCGQATPRSPSWPPPRPAHLRGARTEEGHAGGARLAHGPCLSPVLLRLDGRCIGGACGSEAATQTATGFEPGAQTPAQRRSMWAAACACVTCNPTQIPAPAFNASAWPVRKCKQALEPD
jgi:hypothetical protein